MCLEDSRISFAFLQTSLAALLLFGVGFCCLVLLCFSSLLLVESMFTSPELCTPETAKKSFLETDHPCFPSPRSLSPKSIDQAAPTLVSPRVGFTASAVLRRPVSKLSSCVPTSQELITCGVLPKMPICIELVFYI